MTHGVRTESLAAADVARLIRKAVGVAAYFRGLSGRCHQCHFPQADPLKVAADEALAAAERNDGLGWFASH